jgi:hypothetical protein
MKTTTSIVQPYILHIIEKHPTLHANDNQNKCMYALPDSNII